MRKQILEYANLASLIESISSRGSQVKSDAYKNQGKLPIVDQGQSLIVGYTDEDIKPIVDVPAIVFGDHTRIVKLVDFPFVAGADGTKIIKPKSDKIDRLYLYYLVEFTASKMTNLGYSRHFKELKEADIAYHLSLSEQKRIAAILRAWDEAIEKQDKIIANLQQKRKALLGKLLLKQQANKPLKYFLTSVAREIGKPTSSYHALGLRSHCKGTFQRFIKDASTVAMETLYRVKENDLIVNITFAWEGAIALVKETDEHCLVSHRFPTYEIDRSKALPQFVRHVVQTKKFIESLGIISPGGAGRNRVLNKKDFLELKIWLPDLSTQAHIADIISTIELEIEIAESLLAKFKDQKRGLMQKLLTGEWPVHMEKEAA